MSFVLRVALMLLLSASIVVGQTAISTVYSLECSSSLWNPSFLSSALTTYLLGKCTVQSQCDKAVTGSPTSRMYYFTVAESTCDASLLTFAQNPLSNATQRMLIAVNNIYTGGAVVTDTRSLGIFPLVQTCGTVAPSGGPVPGPVSASESSAALPLEAIAGAVGGLIIVIIGVVIFVLYRRHVRSQQELRVQSEAMLDAGDAAAKQLREGNQSKAKPVVVDPAVYARLERFYKKYNPEKLSTISETLKHYQGVEGQQRLYEMLVKKYGPEPTQDEQAAAPPADAVSTPAAADDLQIEEGSSSN
jgi:hypothetical protein